MIYILAGISMAICIGVIIFGLKIYKENRKIMSQKKNFDDDDDIIFRP